MAGTKELSKVLDETEINTFSEIIQDKVERHLHVLQTRINEFKAKYERVCVNSEQQYFEIEKQLIESNTKLESESSSNEQLKEQLKDLETKYEEASSKLKNVQDTQEGNLTTQLRLTKVNDQLEIEKRELAVLLEKRNSEIDRLNDELKEMSKKVSEANASKCETLAKLDEIHSNEVNKEFQIKRLEQEKENLSKQIDWLNKEVNEKTKELMTVRREKSTKVMEIQSKLDEKSDECAMLQDSVESLKKTNTDQATKIDSFIQRIKDIQDSNSQSEEQFRQEIQARARLAELYKKSVEEAENKALELTGAVTELQKLLRDAAKAHTDMENEKDQEANKLRDEISNREEKIQSLEQELANANDLLSVMKSQGLSEGKVETMFPTAAATSKMLKSGMTLTQIYNEYVQATDSLELEKVENQRLNNYLDQILQEIEEKAPILKKQREDYEQALKSIDQMTKQLDAAMVDGQTLRAEADDKHRKWSYVQKENGKHQQAIQDLSNQIRYLLKEMEEIRGGRVVREGSDEEVSSSEVSSTNRVITDRLVTFRNIEELQEQNQRLLVVIRDLSEKAEREDEEYTNAKTRELKEQLDLAQEELSNLKDARNRQAEMVESIVRQRDMYRVLLQQAGPQVPSSFSMASPAKSPGTSLLKSPDNKKFEETSQALKQLQADFTSYKKEKLENEKILNEQLDKSRQDLADLRVQNAKLASQLDYTSERYKVLQGNAEGYKKEIAHFREKSQKYSTAVAKHEQTINTLKQDLMSTKEQISQAQARVENVKAEKDLIKASEQRLSIELDSIRRERHSQTMLMANLQTIQNNLERNEFETKQRFGKQIEALERDKKSLQKRLEAAEKQHNAANQQWERQLQEVRGQMETEMRNHQRTRDQMQTNHKQMMELKQQYATVSTKLSVAESRVFSLSGDEVERSNEEISDLKAQLATANTEKESSRNQVEKWRQHVEQYKRIADSVQQTVKDQTKASEELQEGLEEKLRQAMEAKEHVEQRMALLEKERQDLLQENIRITEESHNLNADLRKQLASLQNELQESVERRETAIAIEITAKQECDDKTKQAADAQDKYERELMLHAADVEALTALKKQMEGFNNELMEKEEATKSIEQKFKDAKASWERREQILNADTEKKETLIKELQLEIKTLNEQMKKLSNQVISVQERAAHTPKRFGAAATAEDDSSKSSEQLLEVVRYLRREKDIADGKLDVVETEVARVRQRCEVVEKQLDIANKDLAEERQKSQADIQTAAQHAELMQKIESNNILLDTNKLLREENQKLSSQLTETDAKLKKLEEDIKPLQNVIRDLESQREAFKVEKKTIMAEAERWKVRTNQLIEQSHKTDPEEHKKLVQEREEMRKQLSSNTEELHKSRAETTRLSLEITRLQNQAEIQKQENTKLREEQKELTEDVQKKEKENIEKFKTITQLKKIGRKYKEQAESVTKEFDDYKAIHEGQDQEVQNTQQANTEKIQVLEGQVKEVESAKEDLKNTLKDLQSHIKLLEQQLKDSEANSSAVDQKFKESEQKVKDLEQKLNDSDQKQKDSAQQLKDMDQKLKESEQNGQVLEGKLKDLEEKKVELLQKSDSVDSETKKLKEHLQKLESLQQEFDKLKTEHSQLSAESTKIKEEKTELERKVLRSNNVLQTAKSKLQSYKESNDKLTAENNELKEKMVTSGQSSSEESDLRVATVKSMYENKIERLESEVKQLKESATSELEKAVEKLQKENDDLQAKIHQLQHQVDMYQKTGTSQPHVHVSRPTVAATGDRTSASPSEAPKTANIRPIASSPAAVKPQTVPVQPQSAASKVTASIRPMAIAATTVVPMATTTGTPTATVMPTTQAQQEVEGEVSVPVQQLFPAQGTTRPTQQVQRVIPTQEQAPEVPDNQVIVEPQPSTSLGEPRDTPLTGSGAKRHREDTESPGEETIVKRTKVTTTEEQQEIPAITVTDETGLSQEQQTIGIVEARAISDIESHSQSSLDLAESAEADDARDEQEEEAEDDDDDDDDPVIVVGSDESGAADDEYGEEEEEEVEGEEEEDLEDYHDDGDQEGIADVDIYQDIGGAMEEGYSRDGQEDDMQTAEHDEEVVIIDEGEDEVQMESQGQDSLPSSQSVPQSQQSLLPPVQTGMQIERQLSAGSRNQLTPFMLGAANTGFEDFDDCQVPSTPTLMPPRRGDGFAEAVSSPAQINQRFIFGMGGEQGLTIPGLAQLESQAALMDDTRMDLSQLQEGSGRSVPSTPLSTSAPVTVITEASEGLASQSDTSIPTSQLEHDSQYVEESLTPLEEAASELEGTEDDILEGDQGEEDHHDEEEHTEHTDEKEGSSSEAGDQGTREEPEASTSSQEKSQDAGKPKIQKIVWESPAPQTGPPPQNISAIPTIGQTQQQQFRPRGAPRGSQVIRGSRGFPRGQGQMARRSNRGRGMYMRRPPHY